MNISAQIDKLRQIPQTDRRSFLIEGPVFVPRQDISQAESSRPMRLPKPPRNVNLYDPIESLDSTYDDRNSDEYGHLDDSQIAASISTANDGVSYSNDNFEKHWRTKSKQSSYFVENDFKKNVTHETASCSRTFVSKSDTDEKEQSVDNFEKHYKTKQKESSNIDVNDFNKYVMHETTSFSRTFTSKSNTDENEQLYENSEYHCKTNQKRSSSVDENDLEKNVMQETASYSRTTFTSKSDTDEKEQIEDVETVLEKCKLNKNAMIRGLLRNHTISVKDLVVPNDSSEIKTTDKLKF